MKTKILLILFGTLFGIGLLELALHFLLPHKGGTEFASVSDFRNQLLDEKAAKKAERSEGVAFASVINPDPDDRVIYELRPNLDVKFTGVPVKTNSCGMRDIERPHVKPFGTYRIALLGDSFVFGWGVDFDKSFAQVLERRLNEMAGGRVKIEVLNFGVPGYSTFQEIATFERKGLEFDPDLALVFFIHNDFDFPFFVRDSNSPTGLVESFSIAKLGAQTLNPVLQKSKDLMKGLDPQTMLEEFGKVGRERGIKTFLTINPRKEWQECLRRLTPAIASNAVTYFSLVEDFERIERDHGYTESDLNLPHDPHPTALRSAIYGELLADNLWPVISEALN